MAAPPPALAKRHIVYFHREGVLASVKCSILLRTLLNISPLIQLEAKTHNSLVSNKHKREPNI